MFEPGDLVVLTESFYRDHSYTRQYDMWVGHTWCVTHIEPLTIVLGNRKMVVDNHHIAKKN